MKTLIKFAIIMGLFSSYAQNKVYNKSGDGKSIAKELNTLIFSESNVPFPEELEESGLIATLIPSIVDLGFKIATTELEKRKKKFTYEYSLSRSYLNAGKKFPISLQQDKPDGTKETITVHRRVVPNFIFERKIKLKDGALETAFKVSFKAMEVEGADGFIYYIDDILLNKSGAKTTAKNFLMDYSFEIKPTLMILNDKKKYEKKVQELSPITLKMIDFGANSNTELRALFATKEYRTEIIPLSREGRFAELSLKIIETNPAQVNIEKVLETINTYKEDAKTIINNIIDSKKEDEEGGETDDSSDDTQDDTSTKQDGQ